MADSIAFTTACEALEASSSLDRLEARGTIRLTLKESGLEATTVSPSQLRVAVEKLLPAELEARGVHASVASKLVSVLNNLSDGVRFASDSPEAIFSRMGK